MRLGLNQETKNCAEVEISPPNLLKSATVAKGTPVFLLPLYII